MKMTKNENGFSLIEIIVSLAIVGIISITFLTIFTSGVSNIFSAGNKSEALLESQAQLEDAIAKGTTSEAFPLTITLNGSPVTVNGLKFNYPSPYNNGTRNVDLVVFIPKSDDIVPGAIASNFNEVGIGDYISIQGILFQKTSDTNISSENRILKTTITGSSQWSAAVSAGTSYNTFSEPWIISSSLLSADELVSLDSTILDNDTFWWTSTQQNATRAWFVDDDGNRSHITKTNIYGVRPALTLSDGLTVAGGTGSQSNPYTLTN